MSATRTARPAAANPKTRRRDGGDAGRSVEPSTAPAVGEAAFKSAMRQVASAVSIVTSKAGDRIDGLAATNVCTVSADPPMLLVCVRQGVAAEPLIAEAGAFAVSFLTEEQHRIARLFSIARGPAARFADGRWLGGVTGAPMLEGALASFDCVVEDRFTSGGNSIYLGRVVGASSHDGACLIYRDGSFRRLAPAV